MVCARLVADHAAEVALVGEAARRSSAARARRRMRCLAMVWPVAARKSRLRCVVDTFSVAARSASERSGSAASACRVSSTRARRARAVAGRPDSRVQGRPVRELL